LLERDSGRSSLEFKNNSFFGKKSLRDYAVDENTISWRDRKKLNFENYSAYSFIPNKLLF